MSASLYLVATPIGNLEDITLRALRILREADLIAAEDTRRARKLLSHFQIGTPLVACHQHSSGPQIERLIAAMTAEGRSIALVTDAGTPGISDPGAEMVQAALAAGVPVVPIPGASAVLCALVASGLPTARFAFEGFLPRTRSDRLARLAHLAQTETRTLIVFEAANRTAATLLEMAGLFGADRPAAVGRELTKRFEEFLRGGLGDLAARCAAHAPRGEIVLVVAGHDTAPEEAAVPAADDLERALAAALQNGLSERDAVRQVSADLRLGRRDVYAAMLAHKKDA